jgi:hypothetical protein
MKSVRAFILAAVGAAALFPAPVVTPVAPAGSIFVGQNVVIDIEISDADFTNGYQFDLSFTSSLLQFVSVVEGTFLPFPLFASPLFDDSDAANGNVKAIANYMADTGVSGKGLLVQATFLTLAPGMASVTATGGLYTRCDDFATCVQEDIVATTIETANFEILGGVAVPEPSAVALALTGLAAIAVGTLRRRR